MIPSAADGPCVNRNRHPHTPLLDPPEGLVEMVCTLFADDPVSTEAYAIFGAQIDLFLGSRGLRRWADLAVMDFLRHAAHNASEAVTLCCMLSTVVPWLARSGEMSALEANAMLRRLLEVCPEDEDAEAFMCNSIDDLERARFGVAELRH
jgi:hypothetical protein